MLCEYYSISSSQIHRNTPKTSTSAFNSKILIFNTINFKFTKKTMKGNKNKINLKLQGIESEDWTKLKCLYIF